MLFGPASRIPKKQQRRAARSRPASSRRARSAPAGWPASSPTRVPSTRINERWKVEPKSGRSTTRMVSDTQYPRGMPTSRVSQVGQRHQHCQPAGVPQRRRAKIQVGPQHRDRIAQPDRRERDGRRPRRYGPRRLRCGPSPTIARSCPARLREPVSGSLLGKRITEQRNGLTDRQQRGQSPAGPAIGRIAAGRRSARAPPRPGSTRPAAAPGRPAAPSRPSRSA